MLCNKDIYVKRNLDQIIKLYDDDDDDDDEDDSNIDLFDNSDYPKTSKFFYDRNKKVIGKFKDEAAGKIINEYAGLKPKMYTIKTDSKNEKKSKGVKKMLLKMI